MTDPAPYSPTPDPYERHVPVAALRAPNGTDPYTVWIWLIVAIPVVQVLPVFFIDWSAFVTASVADPTGIAAFSMFFSRAYVALIAFGWIGLGLQIWCAYRDWRELQSRGVPQPFHWAWIFLALAVSYAVYSIGRSVVVKRRTGRGLAPMWVTIASIVASFAIGIWITVVIVQLIVDAVMMMPFGP